MSLLLFPDPRINVSCVDIRKFNSEVEELIKILKDEAEKNNLKALSAVEIAYPYRVIVIRDGNNFLELINTRIIKEEDYKEIEEEIPYYPNLKIKIKRPSKIKIYYQDRNGNEFFKEFEGEKAFLIAQKVDLSFGITPLLKLSKKERNEYLKKLEENGLAQVEVCPPFSKREYFPSVNDKLIFIGFIFLVLPFFGIKKDFFFTFNKYILLPLTIIIMSAFLVYAYFESKKYTQCTSCQVGNNATRALFRALFATIITILSFVLY